jgi:hypothetical protein
MAAPDQAQTPSGQIYHMAASMGSSIHPHSPSFLYHQFVKKEIYLQTGTIPEVSSQVKCSTWLASIPQSIYEIASR